MLSDHLSVRGEFVYTNYASEEYDLSGSSSFGEGGATIINDGTGEVDFSTTEFRLGLNYRF